MGTVYFTTVLARQRKLIAVNNRMATCRSVVEKIQKRVVFLEQSKNTVVAGPNWRPPSSFDPGRLSELGA